VDGGGALQAAAAIRTKQSQDFMRV